MLQRVPEKDPATIDQKGNLTPEGLGVMKQVTRNLENALLDAREAQRSVVEVTHALEMTIVGKVALLSGVPNYRATNPADSSGYNNGEISENVFITKIVPSEQTTREGEYLGTRVFIEGYNDQFMRVFGFLSDILDEAGLGLRIEAVQEPTDQLV